MQKKTWLIVVERIILPRSIYGLQYLKGVQHCNLHGTVDAILAKFR